MEPEASPSVRTTHGSWPVGGDACSRGAAGRGWLGFIAILSITLGIAYGRSLGGGFLWDDDYYVWRNPLLSDLAGLRTIWLGILDGPIAYPLPQYYPTTHTSFWIEHAVWGSQPVGYRITNLLLHAASSALIWRILRALEVPGAAVAAVLFAVHPLHVESVAWITERKNVLSAVLGLAAFYALLRHARLDPQQNAEFPTRDRRPLIGRWYAVGTALFVFALGAKSVVATLPAAFLVVVWWKRGRIEVPDVLAAAPLLLIGGAYGMLTAYMEVHRVGASGPDWDYAPTAIGEIGARTQIAGRAVCFYLGKLLVPWPLMFSYPRWTIAAGNLAGYCAPLAVLASLVGLWAARSRVGRGPAAAGLLFVGLLTPAMGFSNVYPMRFSFVADHFCYLASVPILAAITAGGTLLLRRLRGQRRRTLAASVIVLPCVLVLILLTRRHAATFRDLETLWLETLARNPRSWLALDNLAVLHMNRGEDAAARALLERTLREVKPGHATAMLNLAELDRRAGDIASAMARVSALLAEDREVSPGWLLRGKLLEQEGKFTEAADAFGRAASLPGASSDARTAYARSLIRAAGQEPDAAARQRLLDEAERQLRAALDLDPTWVDALSVRANLLMQSPQRTDEARRLLGRAARLDPSRVDVANMLAVLDIQAGRFDQAEARLRDAIRRRPDAFEPLLNLGLLLGQRGAIAEARELLRRADAIRPGDPRIARRLAEWQQ